MEQKKTLLPPPNWYNIENLSNFFVKHDFAIYRTDNRNRIYKKINNGYRPVFADHESLAINLNWSKAMVYHVILEFDDDYRNMIPAQKAELINAILAKIRFTKEEEIEHGIN